MTDTRTFGALTAAAQAFEEGVLGMPVWRVTVAGAAAKDDLAALAATARADGIGLASLRIADDDPLCALLPAAGFRAVETLLTFEGPIPPTAAMPDDVRPAGRADIAACRRVAEASFRHDRFHTDTAIENGAADLLKAQWIENDISGRADTVLVAETDGAVCGFNACLLADDAAVIDLIGVHPHAQGRGVGRSLVEGAMAVYAGRRSRLRVGTQENNLPSQQLYRRFGMRVVRRQVTFHWTERAVGTAASNRAEAG